MINTICWLFIVVIILLPFVLKSFFKFSDYYGFIMGARCLIMIVVANSVINSIMPKLKVESEYDIDFSKLSSQDQKNLFLKELVQSIAAFYILYNSVSNISKPTQNYNLVFMFISGMMIQYIFSFIAFMILPSIGRISVVKKLIEEGKMSGKYFTEEYAFNSILNCIFRLVNDIGVTLLMMLYLKKLVDKSLFFLNFFLKNIARFLMLSFGLLFIDKFYNFAYVAPFVFGMLLFFYKISKGQLSNRFKDESDID